MFWMLQGQGQQEKIPSHNWQWGGQSEERNFIFGTANSKPGEKSTYVKTPGPWVPPVSCHPRDPTSLASTRDSSTWGS